MIQSLGFFLFWCHPECQFSIRTLLYIRFINHQWQATPYCHDAADLPTARADDWDGASSQHSEICRERSTYSFTAWWAGAEAGSLATWQKTEAFYRKDVHTETLSSNSRWPILLMCMFSKYGKAVGLGLNSGDKKNLKITDSPDTHNTFALTKNTDTCNGHTGNWKIQLRKFKLLSFKMRFQFPDVMQKSN